MKSEEAEDKLKERGEQSECSKAGEIKESKGTLREDLVRMELKDNQDLLKEAKGGK